MAQASTVQREPSMEEILASIRRIIEDNDSGRRPSVDFGQVKPEPEDDRGDRNVIEVEAFRAELQATKPAAVEPKSEAHAAKPASVAVKPELPKKEAAATWPSAEPAAPTVPEAPVPAAEVAVPSRPVASAWTPVSTRAVERMEELAGPAPEEPAPVPTPKLPEPIVVVGDPAAAKPAIISEQAGRQVSAAFGELNEAYAARNRKSFDEIATEMLRPMLQDWLDNNLPILVEKLVREEIERIARGAQ